MKKKKRILLVVETSRGHGRGILEGIASYVREKGDWQVFFEDRGVLQSPSKWFSTWQGDGIIARSIDKETGDILRKKKLPLVEILGGGGGGAFSVDIDENADCLGELAVEHLWDRGLRNFAFFCADNTEWSRRRGTAFQNKLAERGASCSFCPLPDPNVKDHFLDGLVQSADSSLVEWLQSLSKPVGILTAIDIQAFYILAACQAADIAVPEEVAILGCGNDALVCSLLTPQLSSVDLNSRLLGYTAAQLLDEKMRNPGKVYPPIVYNPSHVVVRQSTDIIAINDPDIAKAIRYIRDHFMEPINIDSIADSVALSPRTLQRRFHDHLGRSPEAELIRMRLDHAKYLLQSTNFPVAKICQRIGFASPQYFMRVFRRELGLTPNQYRQKNQIVLFESPFEEG